MDRGSLRVAAALSHKDPVTRAAFCASHGDDNLSLGVSFSLVPKRFGDLTQLVAPIDDRRDLFGLDELLQDSQVLPVVPHDEHPHALAHERRQQKRLDLTSEPKPTTEVRDPDQDVRPSRGQRPSAVREWTVSDQVEHHVVAPLGLGEVLLRVVDDPAGAERADQVDVPRAADAGHVSSKRLRDLHGERADTARCTVDQHPVPNLHLPLIANGGEGCERGVSDGRRLLEREVGRLRQEVALHGAGILGEGAPTPAEHLITRSKLLDASADRLDLTGDIESRHRAPRLTQARHRAHNVRHAPHEVPVADIDGRRPDPYEHVVVLDDRLVDGSELQDVRGAVLVLDHRLHHVLLVIAKLGPSLKVPDPADPMVGPTLPTRGFRAARPGRPLERQATAQNWYGFPGPSKWSRSLCSPTAMTLPQKRQSARPTAMTTNDRRRRPPPHA